MKVLITESKLFNAIYQYIDSYLNSNEINWVYGRDGDEDNDEYPDNEDSLVFYKGGTWAGEDYSDIVFNYFMVDYYEDTPGSYKDEAPILEVMGEYGEHLDSMFNKHWEEPMKKWFEDNFNLPVNTVSTYYE
jgi:hypothetical protein